MRLIVGLGNPGRQYAGHRHNVGFMAADEIVRRHGFGPERRKFESLIREGRIGGERCLLLKPQTFMNESGRAVSAALRFYKLALDEIIVLHDELDLAFGRVRAKLGGGAAGHNGLRSIIRHVGDDFWRVRIGIGHPGAKERVTPWVLSDFGRDERDFLERLLLPAVADALPALIAGDAGRFASEVARLAPPAEAPVPAELRLREQDKG
ncbi:MAG: aminoacyl-tRNA hydrolase [Alphaproteobacteria bacterium]|nr:MAG: aminoacyl-tRNA hydrolase [Alphaproteobacteria bacterium]